jgi:hypothetical protein
MKALEREKEEKQRQDRLRRLEQLQQLDEDGEVIEDDRTESNDSGNEGDTKEDTNKATDTPAAAELDSKLTKKGNLYEGQARVNGAETTSYLLNVNPSLTVAIISDEFFIKLRDAGTISDADFKNEKETNLSDGSTAKGDILTLQSLQVGDVMMTNVEAKINTSTPQNLVVGLKVIEKNGCTFDAKKVSFKCK